MHSIFDIQTDQIYSIYLLDLSVMEINGILPSRNAINLQYDFKKELNEIEKNLRKLRGGGYNTIIHKILMSSRYMFVISQYELTAETIEGWKARKYFINQTKATGADLLNEMTILNWREKIPGK